MKTLEIKDLHVSVEGKEILKGINLQIKQGEVHAIMGPNGSGKSTLSYAIMGHPKYVIMEGHILLDGQDITKLSPDKRAQLGLFLAFQYPHEISGVSVFNFLRNAYTSLQANGTRTPEAGTPENRAKELQSIKEFRSHVQEKIKLLGISDDILKRYLNEGFSGGEKKRCEILQLAVLNPKIAILDETDSGLDIDALKTVAQGMNALAGPEMGVLLITHYNRILNYIKPHFVHVLIDGKIAKSGTSELAQELEEKGYDWVKNESQVAA
ncbi:MAG: Fe-S cluster assembly ATPase SufC [Candidatus Aenigmarchaeota archaeon]|nr:Fe-S cluster assembly ATPase SufC [Candidatus Aenigmarchaeota archaeon]